MAYREVLAERCRCCHRRKAMPSYLLETGRRTSVRAMKVRVCALAAMVMGCGVKAIAPPAAPAKVVPVPGTRLGPPVTGNGSVLIDADQPNVVVHEITGSMETVAYGSRGGMAYGVSVATQRLCITPCQVHLPQGLHQLMFESPATGWGGVGDLQLGVDVSAYRYALGHRVINAGPRLGALMALSFGITGMLGGGIWYLASDSYRSVSGGVAIGSGALFALGVALAIAFRPEEQNGTGVQWTPDSPGPALAP